MAERNALGSRFTCYQCESKFYDLGKPDPICPKCGADQRERPAPTPQSIKAAKKPRRRREPEAFSEDAPEGAEDFDENFSQAMSEEFSSEFEDGFEEEETEETEEDAG